MKFYIVTNINRDEPEEIKPFIHIRIKGKADGSETLICSCCEIVSELLVEKSLEDCQSLVDSWINEENSVENLDTNGNQLVQKKIDILNLIGA